MSGIYLFTNYDRASFKKEFGVDAPAFDWTRAPKQWRDPSKKGVAMATYSTPSRDAKGFWSLRPFTLTGDIAAEVNLSGPIIRPQWNAPASGISIQTGGGTLSGTLVDQHVASEQEAKDFAAEIGAALNLNVTYGEQPLSPPPDVVTGMGDRRNFFLYIPGVTQGVLVPGWRTAAGVTPLAVGFVELAKYQAGVGHPGTWSIVDGKLVFTPTPDGPTTNTLAHVPWPIRPLADNEMIIDNGLFGLAIGPKMTGSAPTPANEDVRLQDIETRVTALEATLKLITGGQ